MSVTSLLYVSKPVSSLQVDINTTGTVTLVLDPSYDKQLDTESVDGVLRIIVEGYNENTFVGLFATVDAPILSIGNIVTADADGLDAEANIYNTIISSPVGWVSSGVSGTARKVTNTVTGLPTDIYVDGKGIQALGDGKFVYEGTVTDGSVTLPWYANKIHVGLPFTTKIKPVNPTPSFNQGVVRGKKQKINRVTLCFQESVRCQVGIDESHLFDINYYEPGTDALRPAPPYFEAGVLKTGDMTVDLQGEWLDKATLAIVHDQPLPLTVKAVIPHISINEPT
jgi:hypothetical protein